jgi:hypothetical protein
MYGGMVITGVADRMAERVRALVYLDAFVPQHGDSLNGLLSKALAPEVAAQFLGAFRGTALQGHSGLMQPIPAEMFNIAQTNRARVDRLCRPQALATFEMPLLLTGALDKVPSRSYPGLRRHDSAPSAGLLALFAHLVHRLDRDHRMRVGGAGAHFGGDPDRLHHLGLGRTALQCQLGVAADAVRALRDVRRRDGDQLLGLGRQRAVGEGTLAESAERGIGLGRQLAALLRQLPGHLGVHRMRMLHRVLPRARIIEAWPPRRAA